MSFGSQGSRDAMASMRWPAATSYARSVAGVYGRDRWTMSPAVRLDYGLRLDRYDYLDSLELLSGEGRLRARVLPRTFVVAGAARRMVAPGADEFLPPATGPWLPPERTFSAVRRGDPLRAEEIRRGDIGVAREFGAGAGTAAIEIRRFREISADQMATLFGFDDTRGLGHYAVGSAGRVDVSGWTTSLQGRLGGRLDGRLEYTVAEAEWTDDAAAAALARAVPVAAWMPSGRVHDLAATVDADLQETSTRITVMIRANSAFLVEPSPSAASRFDVRIRQALPYQPFGGQRLELVFAARTLFRDLAATGAFYDELLAMSPPLRFMAGVQVRF